MTIKNTDTTLTGSQIAQIRANLARKASQMGNRLVDNGLGALKDKSGQPLELSAGQIKSLLGVLSHILPAMQSTDITVDDRQSKSMDELREESVQFLMNAGMTEVDANQALDRMAQDAIH